MSLSPDSTASTDEVHGSAEAALGAVDQQYTANRRTLVELLASAEAPLSLPEIMERQPELAQSSVYRSLAVLEQAGVALRIVTGDEFARFELAEEHSGHHHHHLICSGCGSVEDVTLPSEVEASVVRELEALAERHGFAPSDHQVDLIGRCAGCQRANSGGS